MPLKVILLGEEEKNFSFLQRALNKNLYEFDFHRISSQETIFPQLIDASLIIIDTVPVDEKNIGEFYFLRESSQFSHIPVLALVKSFPPRLRYRLISMGINDYLTIPFDKLDVQVRVRNLIDANKVKLLSGGAFAGVNQTEPSVVALQTLTHLYQDMNRAIINLNKEGLLLKVLTSLRNLCRARYCLLFEINDEQELILQHAFPKESATEMPAVILQGNMPILIKASRFQEPTFLNKTSPTNPLVKRLNQMFGIEATSIIIYPIVVEKVTRSILCILKTDNENYTDLHYLLVQNLAYFISQSYYLANLKSDLNTKMDSKVWKYYFDFLDQVINQLDYGIIVIGKEHRIKYANKNASKLLQIPQKELLHQPLSAVVTEEVVNDILASVENRSPFHIERPELEIETPGGTKLLIGFSVQDFTDKLNKDKGYIVSLQDITYTKEIQEEMRRVDRLASLGVMASGIAHEIRNPLAGIKAMAQTFEEELAADDPKGEYVQRIIRLVNRLDDLLRTLFSYAKPPKPDRKRCSVESVLVDVISLLRQKIRDHRIELTRSIHPNLPFIYVDPGQIQQVLMNLLLNSIEAITDRGEISVSVQPFTMNRIAKTDADSNYLALLKAGKYVRICIRDNGCGIQSENLRHIFNPFFTTKTFGTGLGLSIVYQIVKENSGAIHFESESDSGTNCYLYLPMGDYVIHNGAKEPA